MPLPSTEWTLASLCAAAVKTAYIPPFRKRQLAAAAAAAAAAGGASVDSGAAALSSAVAVDGGAVRPVDDGCSTAAPATDPRRRCPGWAPPVARSRFPSEGHGTASHGVFATQGKRRSMEDRHVIVEVCDSDVAAPSNIPSHSGQLTQPWSCVCVCAERDAWPLGRGVVQLLRCV